MATKSIKNKAFNLFDLIIVLLVVLCVIGIIFKSFFIKQDSFNEMLSVKFRIDNILEVTADEIVKNHVTDETMYLSGTGDSIGIIKSLVKDNEKLYITDSNGDSIYVNDPLKYNLTGSATLFGKQGANYFLCNGSIEIKYDTVINVYTKSAIFQLRIIEIL